MRALCLLLKATCLGMLQQQLLAIPILVRRSLGLFVSLRSAPDAPPSATDPLFLSWFHYDTGLMTLPRTAAPPPGTGTTRCQA